MNDHGRKEHEPLNPDSSDVQGDVEYVTPALSPKAEALSKALRAKFCGWDDVYDPSDMPEWEIFRTIVEQLGITEETVDECMCGAGYALGRCKHCSSRIDILSTILELANHDE